MARFSIEQVRRRVSHGILLILLLALSSQGPLGCAGIARSSAQGDITAVKAFIAGGADPNDTDWKNRSAIKLAIILKKREVLELLIEAGADVNRRGKGDQTPLMWASMRWGSPEVINMLLDAGADPNLTDTGGQTPLLYSVRFGTADQTRALIARGADVTVVMAPKWKSPVLNVAIRYKKVDAVRALVAAGADLEARDARGVSARELAAGISGMSWAIENGLGRSGQTTVIAKSLPPPPAPRKCPPFLPAKWNDARAPNSRRLRRLSRRRSRLPCRACQYRYERLSRRSPPGR